jgi:hypothetical protein
MMPTTVFERGPSLDFLERDCISIQQGPVGLTQRLKATVIFWTADLFLTASARIVLVMIQGALWSWQVLTRRWVAGRGTYASIGLVPPK